MSVSVVDVRNEGYKVSIFHLRRYWIIVNGTPVIEYFPACVFPIENALPTGGQTFVRLTAPNGKEFIGSAECCNKDHYNRKRGVQIALNRAIKNKNWMEQGV